MPADAPRVTVSLVTYNGMSWLPRCIASALGQDLPGYELLILDNASTDGSAEWLRERASQDARISLRVSPVNLGFAAAHNRHIARARGEFVLLLNQDVELDRAFVRHAVAAFAGRPRVAAVQGRLRRLGPTGERTAVLDTTGLVMRRDRRAVSRRQGQHENDRDLEPGPVWGVDGPAPVYRLSALLDSREPRHGGGWEVLDEDFFMYKEDVDLAWRLRLFGWQAWYAPDALGWHARSAPGADATLGATVRRHLAVPHWIRLLSWRNQRLMQIKNERLRDYLRDLPWITMREVLSLGLLLLVAPLQLRALSGLLRHAPWALRKRRFLHKRRLAGWA